MLYSTGTYNLQRLYLVVLPCNPVLKLYVKAALGFRWFNIEAGINFDSALNADKLYAFNHWNYVAFSLILAYLVFRNTIQLKLLGVIVYISSFTFLRCNYLYSHKCEL